VGDQEAEPDAKSGAHVAPFLVLGYQLNLAVGADLDVAFVGVAHRVT